MVTDTLVIGMENHFPIVTILVLIANLLCIFKFRVHIVPRYAIKGLLGQVRSTTKYDADESMLTLGQVEQEPKILPLSTFPSGIYRYNQL